MYTKENKLSTEDFDKAVNALRKAGTSFEKKYNHGGYYKMIDGKFIQK